MNHPMKVTRIEHYFLFKRKKIFETNKLKYKGIY